MKTLIFASALLLSTTCSASCAFTTSDTPDIRQIVNSHGGYAISGQRCQFLNERGLKLRVEGAAYVLEGVSVGWASVTLQAKGTEVASFLSSSSTFVDAKKASQPVADGLLYKSLSNAIANLDFDKAAQEIATTSAK